LTLAEAAPIGAVADAVLADVFREEAAAVTTSVLRITGDFGVAEEIVGDTFLTAVEHWRRDGVPPRPGAWLVLAAKRRALDRVRRDGVYRAKLAAVGTDAPDEPSVDDRIRLMFLCCHPALSTPAQVALTLRAVLGFTIPDIAAAFIASEVAVAKRLSRARQKISAARITSRMPPKDEAGERLSSVLAVLYLMFNEGYLSSRSDQAQRRDLAEDAAWLTAALADAMPDEPETIGLLALMRFHLARSRARFDDAGGLILLRDQDRGRWDRAAIAVADRLLERAARLRRPGPYQIQAAIVACHATAPTWEETDWVQILVLYDRLLELAPSPIVRLNRAVALREVLGPDAAFEEVEMVAADLGDYHLFHATRGELLHDLGRHDAARNAGVEALRLTGNPAERALLQRRLFT